LWHLWALGSCRLPWNHISDKYDRWDNYVTVISVFIFYFYFSVQIVSNGFGADVCHKRRYLRINCAMVGLVVRQSVASQSGHVAWVHHTHDRIQSYRPGAISQQTDVSIQLVFAPKWLIKRQKMFILIYYVNVTIIRRKNNINVNCVFAHFQRIFRHHTRIGDAWYGHWRTTCCIVHRRSADSHVSIYGGYFFLSNRITNHISHWLFLNWMWH